MCRRRPAGACCRSIRIREWFRTGDLGLLGQPTDNLTYVDRVKDSLRSRGENISSVEVETDGDASPGRAGGRGGRGPE